MKQRLFILIPLVLVLLAFVGYRLFFSEVDEDIEIAEVERDQFDRYVVSMGELEAHRSQDIIIPKVLQNRTVHIWRMEINDIIREGTRVEKGDYVAKLDPEEVEEEIRDTEEDMDRDESRLNQAQMDSSLTLSEARDEIRKSEDDVLDKEIKVEQSTYESQAVQRQAEIELDMARRSLEQKKRNYQQQKRKHELRVKRYEERLREELEYMEILQELKGDLTITAPSPGVIVYAEDRHGNKKKAGSHVSRWEPRIAILPDLSTMLSVTFVKEIDVTKIKEAMPVEIKVDAFPGETFDGEVISIANIGQSVEGQFLNGFKVQIEVDAEGIQLLPGMTSTNKFIIESLPDQLLIPREAVFVEEAQQVVYKKTPLGIVRQRVEVSGENDEYARITDGLKEGDKVLLTAPQ